MSKAKTIVVTIFVILAIFATYMIFLKDPDTDGDGVTDEEERKLGTDPSNPNDAKKGTLIYDSTGNNYARGTRGGSDNETNMAFIVTQTSNGVYETTDVLMDESIVDKTYMALSGIFKIDGSSGAKIVTKYIESEEKEIDLKVGSISTNYKNVQVETNAIAVVIAEHTFGFCTDPTDPLVFVSLDKKPAFFTDVILSGVTLPKDFINATDILNIDILSDLREFIEAFNLNYNLTSRFILADEIDYQNEIYLEADVLDIITPDDLTKLIDAVGGGNFPESSYSFISNTLEYVDMELLIINELDNTLNDFTLWFVVGLTDLTREELQGIVTLKISVVDKNLVANKLGIDIGNPTDETFKINYAVCGDRDPYIPAQMEYNKITNLWDSLDNNSENTTGIKSVEVDSFAIVLDLETLINSLGNAFGTDMSFLSSFTTVRNPAVALLIDQNFTQGLSFKTSILNYLGIALFPDFQVEGNAFYLLNIKGVLYDTSIFIGWDLAKIPLIVSDFVTDGTSNAIKTSLGDIYENTTDSIGSELITHIEIEGFAMGTTMVTAASYLQYFDVTGITAVIARSPIDVGLYDISDEGENGNTYHTAMVQFTVGKGQSYFADHVNVSGFYFNLNKANELMADAFDLADGFGMFTLFTDLMDGILGLFGHRYLDGFILAYDIISEPLNEMRVDSVLVDDEIYDENGVTVNIEGEITNVGEFEILPRVKTVITSPSGQMYFDSGYIHYDGFWKFLPAAFLLPGWEGSFKLDKFIADPDIGTYEVDIYLVQFGEDFGFGKNLGYAHTNFTVWQGIEVTVTLTHFTMLDYIDSFWPSDKLAEPYFSITIWRYTGTSNVIATDFQDGDISLYYTVKVFDYINEVDIQIAGYDEDVLDDDVLDLSAIGTAVDIVYQIDTNTWTGDTTTNVASGEDDGSYDTDEDDARITFDVYDSEG